MLTTLLKSMKPWSSSSSQMLARGFARLSVRNTQNRDDDLDLTDTNKAGAERTLNLGPIDEIVPKLRQYKSADWLRGLNYETEVKPVLSKYSELGMIPEHLNKLAKRYPCSMAMSNNPQKKTDIVALSKHLQEKYGVTDKDKIRTFVLRHPDVLKSNLEYLDEQVKARSHQLGLNEEQVKRLVSDNVLLIYTTQKRLDTLQRIFVSSMGFSTDQLLDMLEKRPIYFTVPSEQIDTQYLALIDSGFSTPEIRRMVYSYITQVEDLPILLALKPGNFRQTLEYLSERIPEEKVREIYLNYPMLFTVEFANFLIKKFQLFKYHGFNDKEIMSFFVNYPEIFIKFKYLLRRGRMVPQDDKAFPAILCFRYVTFIRARGEIMLKYDAAKRPSWTQVIAMTDQEFCDLYEISISELEAFKTEVEQTAEIDVTNEKMFRQLKDHRYMQTK